MQKIGLLVLILIAILLGTWQVLIYHPWFTVSQVECRQSDQTVDCPSYYQKLIGKSLFSFKINRDQLPPEVISVKKIIPHRLVVQLTQNPDQKIYAGPIRVIISQNADSKLKSHPQVQKTLSLLDNDSLGVAELIVVDQTTVVMSTANLHLIAELDHLPDQIEKWKIINQLVDWSEFTDPIREVDLRFKLPILRTKPQLSLDSIK